MESMVVERETGIRQASQSPGPRRSRFMIMRTLAKHTEGDIKLLEQSVDADGHELRRTLEQMLASREVQVMSRHTRGAHRETFKLTLEGWGEYLGALGELYEFPE